MMHPQIFPKLSKLDIKPLRRLMSQGQIVNVEPDDVIDLFGGAILWDGELGRLKVCSTEMPNKIVDATK